ncbi:MAG: hypothetical protein DI566_07665 [Microbacterium sp.]|nr:MAG: hypothetical protein DI566_07665 [Microbacterium sp.]
MPTASGAGAGGRADAGEAAPRLRVDVRRGDPTAEELAAVVAVVTESYEREAAAALAEPDARPSAWQVSTRALRAPLRRDIRWGRFGG